MRILAAGTDCQDIARSAGMEATAVAPRVYALMALSCQQARLDNYTILSKDNGLLVQQRLDIVNVPR